MKKLALTLAVGAAAISATANATAILYEETLARQEEQRILTHPIAGIENSLWFDYRIDVTEAQKELSSDLRRASDVEDLRDAWEEYAFELRHEREDYIHDMAKRGYRGYVTIEN